MKSIPIAALRREYDYNPATGALTRKKDGGEAFKTASREGYFFGGFRRKKYMAHRVAWAMYHGKQPLYIDHINGDPGDNRIENLRSVSKAQNSKNRKKHSNGMTSKWLGVCFVAERQKWRAYVTSCRKKKYLGLHGCETSAAISRALAASNLGFDRPLGV